MKHEVLEFLKRKLLGTRTLELYFPVIEQNVVIVPLDTFVGGKRENSWVSNTCGIV